jgi:hypothetical protein
LVAVFDDEASNSDQQAIQVLQAIFPSIKFELLMEWLLFMMMCEWGTENRIWETRQRQKNTAKAGLL